MPLIWCKYNTALRNNNTDSYTPSLRIKEPDTYDGSRSAAVIDSWIQAVERYANFHSLNDSRTGLLAITLLRGRADAWYRSLKHDVKDPLGWLELKRELIDFFRPDNATLQWNGITKKLINYKIKTQMSSIDHSCHLSSSSQLKRYTINSLINECRLVETTPDQSTFPYTTKTFSRIRFIITKISIWQLV
ncbi:hypothetical protein [Parasitella parasitica]|uniref:Retrotransposon gag domain-containing protein n=1 Tax=Parasitella parasitica TaxID=35722 RepID=A0A0B7NPA4_9FUNG|nr:hypothetical protein [Parasitella parasitica]